MPVFVDPKACVDREHCFAAAGCPYDAYIHNPLKRTWEVDANICGDCPGPCVNFCDKYAVHWGDDLVDLQLVRAGVEGKMKPEEVSAARIKHKKDVAEAIAKAKAEEEAKKRAAEAAVGGIVAITRANFEAEVLRWPTPVVVDCWADWCAPCKQFSPIFEATSKQYEGVVKFAKLDTDNQPALAQGLGVQALPTVLMFYKGQIVNVVEGALPAAHFQSWIYQTLTAVRQYEAQLSAEAEHAISGALENLAALDALVAEAQGQAGAGAGGEQDAAATPSSSQGGASSGLILDSRAASPGDLGGGPKRGPERGRQTSSGLYIP